jgi:hypothetical protein
MLLSCCAISRRTERAQGTATPTTTVLPIILVTPLIVFSISIHCYQIRLPIIIVIPVIVFSISIHSYEIMPEMGDGEL